MACNFERPTPQVLFDRYKNLFSATVLGGAEIVPESNEWYAASLNYAMAEEFHAITDQQLKERDPRTACCENLIAMAALDGLYPNAATLAQGYVRLTGTAGTVLPYPLEFTVDGQTFVSASELSQPTAILDDGTVTVRVRAETAGTDGNVTADTGTMVTVVADVDAEVKVCGGSFCSAIDAEECETFRTRYLARLQYSPRSTQTWLLSKLLEWPCSTRALVRAGSCCQCSDCAEGSSCADCGCADCGGSLEFYLMFDNAFDCGIAPASVITEVQQWLFGSPQGYGNGQVEVGVCGRVRPVTGVPIDVSVDITDCITAAQLTQIKDQIAEYFTTLTPSQTLRFSSIRAVVSGILGVDADFDITMTLTDTAQGYGELGYGPRTDTSVVEVTNCDFIPDCDYMLCVNSVSVDNQTLQESVCT